MPKSLFKRHAIVALLLGALVAAAFAPIVRAPFLQDDFGIIRVAAQPGVNAPSELAYWTQILSNEFGGFAQLANYRPLYWLSFGLDYALYGTDPLGYHVTNLLVHLVASLFVYLLALELVPDERRWWVAATAGVIFALYPIHPGAVTWPAGRVETICAVFFLAALLFFLRWLRSERRLYLALALASFVLALLSKETAFVLPGLLLLCALYKRAGLKRAAFGVAPFAVVLGVFLVIRHYVLLGVSPDYVSAMPLNVVASLRAFAYFTLQMFAPVDLDLLPPGWQGFLDSVFSLGPVLVAAAVGVAAYYYYYAGKTREALLPVLLLALYALPVVPVFRALRLDLTELSPAHAALKVDLIFYGRWFYIPSAFMSILIAYALWKAFGGHTWRLSLAASALVCAAFFAILVANNGPWLRAAEISRELLEAGKTPDFPVSYKGVLVFGDESVWQDANKPPFKEP